MKDGNCFPFIADLPRARQLFDEQLRTNWPTLLQGLLDRNCPVVRDLTRDFKVFRHPNDDQSRPVSWQKMRKGVSDPHRRAQVSDACNKRYGEHLAAASLNETLQQSAANICSRVKKNGRPYRALNPWAIEDYKMLQFISRGENHINGFRNRDLRHWLYPSTATSNDKGEVRKASGRITRRLRILRAHGPIKKVPRTARYLLTAKGRKVATAILAASAAGTQQLMEMAA